jgi:molybdopterin-guanine dinucleotide biosynthesis protein A
MPQGAGVTLGILAGGRATRLGGRDKAWLQRDGVPQVVRIADAWSRGCDAVLVSANQRLSRHAEHGLQAVADASPDLGPLGGLQALAAACGTDWLFSVPVDAIAPGKGVLAALQGSGGDGAVLEDDDGLQPLVALYRVATLRAALAGAFASGDLAVQASQARMHLPRVRIGGLRIGNLNTPQDLRLAGYADA